MPWPQNPLILEINTWTWLNALSRKYSRQVTLASIPANEYDRLSRQGFDAIWLMGVWERSPAGIAIARQHQGIMKDMRNALPDFNENDLAGSPYCIRRYRVESSLGGPEGLAIARKELSRRGMLLILDFVPNHVAPDHPWTLEHPEYFIQGTEIDLASRPGDYLESNNRVFARARDPFYPPWPDILQLDLFNPGLRRALLDTVKDIAGQCDGIRCDMAMLVMNEIFAATWPEKAGPEPESDFWMHIIPEVKTKFPGFIFIAEVYWDKEKDLLDQGFDFVYDKKYYDCLKEGAQPALNHLHHYKDIEGRLLRFLENHDEPRAASLFTKERHKALALSSLALPGAKLIHHGQMEGEKTRVPVFLGRGPVEEPDPEITAFYRDLLRIVDMASQDEAHWSLCNLTGWPDNQSCLDLLAWEWINKVKRLMIITNLSDHPSQGLVKSDLPFLPGRNYQLQDVITGQVFDRNADELNADGLYVNLKAWGMHVLSSEF